METKIAIEGLKQLIRELATEKYQVERNGMAKAALDFVDIIENQANGVQAKEATAILPLVSNSVCEICGKPVHPSYSLCFEHLVCNKPKPK